MRTSISVLLRAFGMPVRPFVSSEDLLDELERLAPGVLLLDIRMPGLGGIELLRELRARDCFWSAVVMSGHGEIPIAVEAIKLGAIEFLEKPFGDEELERAVRAGIDQLPGAVTTSIQRRAARRLFTSLSPRQREVFEGVAQGLTSKEIAQRLGISHRTVESYRLDMMNKLGTSSLVDLIELKPFLRELRSDS